MHAQRTGTNVLQTPTYWTITIGLLDRYNGLKDFPAHIGNFQHNSSKDLSCANRLERMCWLFGHQDRGKEERAGANPHEHAMCIRKNM